MSALAQDLDRIAAETGFSGVVRVDRRDDIEVVRAYGLADRAHAFLNEPETQFGIASGTRGATPEVPTLSGGSSPWSPGTVVASRCDDVRRRTTSETTGTSTQLTTRSRIMNKVSKKIALLGVISPALFAVGAMAQPLQLHSTLAGNNPDIVIGGV